MRVNLWAGKTLSAWVDKAYGIRLGVRQCQRLFRQFEFRLRKPRPVLARADPARQKKHKKLRKLMADTTVDLWALDEVHFQQQGSRCRMWVPPETMDPIVYHHPTRKSASVILPPCVRGMAGFCFAARLENSTEKPSGNS